MGDLLRSQEEGLEDWREDWLEDVEKNKPNSRRSNLFGLFGLFGPKDKDKEPLLGDQLDTTSQISEPIQSRNHRKCCAMM